MVIKRLSWSAAHQLRHHARNCHRWCVIAVLGMFAACGGASTPTSPTTPAGARLDRASVIDGLDYWSSTAGITYVLLGADAPPRLLLRPGTDGLGSAISRGLIDGTAVDNQATSGLVVVNPKYGSSCSPAQLLCREIFRHELGHALGFLDEPPSGLMATSPNTDVLSDREIRMMVALYSLPIGARLQSDGSWNVATTGASGHLNDADAVQDILTYNVNAKGGSAYRTPGLICRWTLPVPVYFDR